MLWFSIIFDIILSISIVNVFKISIFPKSDSIPNSSEIIPFPFIQEFKIIVPFPPSIIFGEFELRFLLLIRKENILNKSSPKAPTKVNKAPKINAAIIRRAKMFQRIWIAYLKIKAFKQLVIFLSGKKIKNDNKISIKSEINNNVANIIRNISLP